MALIEKEIPDCQTVFAGKLNKVWTFWVHEGMQTVTCNWDRVQRKFAIQNFADSRCAKTLRPKVEAIFDNLCQNKFWRDHGNVRSCSRLVTGYYRVKDVRGLHILKYCDECAATESVDKLTKEETEVYRVMES